MRTRPAELVLYDATNTITIRPFHPSGGDEVICTSWDLGAPDVRITNAPRAGVDGTDDGPGLLGARLVTLNLVFMGQDPYEQIDKISAMAHPSARPVLRVTRTVGQSWMMPLRGVPFPITYGRRAAGLIEAAVTFSCPQGYLESPLRGPFSAIAANNADATDWGFPAKFPKTFGPGHSPYATATVTVRGSLPISPVIYIFGPAHNPRVFTDAGENFAFENLTLTTGQAVQIDMSGGTVRAANHSLVAYDNHSLWTRVDFTTSNFWTWQPGVHVVRYATTGGSMAVQYRERRLNI